jgi:hypothetical protein
MLFMYQCTIGIRPTLICVNRSPAFIGAGAKQWCGYGISRRRGGLAGYELDPDQRRRGGSA